MKTFKLIFATFFLLLILTQCSTNIEKFAGAISQFNADLKPAKIEFVEGFDANTEKGKSRYIGVDIIGSSVIEKMTEKERMFNSSNYAFRIYNCLDSTEINSDLIIRIILSNEKSQSFNYQLNHLKIYKRSFNIIDRFFKLYKLSNVEQTFDLYSQEMITKNKDALSKLFAHINETYGEVKELEILGYEVVNNSIDEIKINIGGSSKKGFFLWIFDCRLIDNDIKIDGLNM